ncbi:hypothetical protein NC651_002018 [Populus alba x Populus x berolinensis]|nr:hypothetical protein NC651_002018 [Populus alba x Populus x berolinensis]
MHVLEKLIAYGQSQYQSAAEKFATTQRLMLDPSTMMKQNLGVKGGDVAFPCGYQNKIDQSDAINLEAMKQMYQRALKAASNFGYQKESPEALVHGAVISAFLTIAQAMSDQGGAREGYSPASIGAPSQTVETNRSLLFLSHC